MKIYQQSCTITLSTGAKATMAAIFEDGPFVTRAMIEFGVKYHTIEWHQPQVIMCKKCRRKKC